MCCESLFKNRSPVLVWEDDDGLTYVLMLYGFSLLNYFIQRCEFLTNEIMITLEIMLETRRNYLKNENCEAI